MKNKILSLLFLALTLPCLSFAQDFVNLTPVPKAMTTGTGELVLPRNFVVGTSGLSTEMAAEADRFVKDFNAATGYQATVSASANALIAIAMNETLGEEAYNIKVTAQNVTIQAKTPAGLYYAFQSIKKVLPANVMAGVKDPSVTRYALPVIDVDDAPRFGYRGFMLDTSRHFFSTEEIKRVLEVMSYYKMNTFHWHITDDQGWRVEITKYPKLTSVGSVSDNSYVVDMKEGPYWLNKPYGPLFYSKEEVKDIVAYAKERHIEIIPEIDMPGHFSAAMAAYPEYSCTPDAGNHRVVSNIGGIYNDVLNVANPAAVQFAKDILTEIMEIFPGKYIHIGGDECPTTAWEQNAECIEKKEKLKLSSFRELQSLFIKDMADHLKAHGREVCVWNEAITAKDANLETLKETGATIYCWTGADNAAHKAQGLGLPHVYTPQYPWYINQKQSSNPDEPAAAGNGGNNLENVYKQAVPAQNNLLRGVQATFWSEYVAFNDYLEYLMLPRLVAIAEAGWSPQQKRNFTDFCKRITADAQLYDYNGYRYGRHYMTTTENPEDKVMPTVSTAANVHWYRLVTRATNDRKDKCIELLRDGSDIILQQGSHGAKANVLWTNAQAAENAANFDAQLWKLEENPYKKGHFALVCKALPEGSVYPQPTANNDKRFRRWNYDATTKHYNFVLGDYRSTGYGKDGENYYYSLRSDQVNDLWMNAAAGGQGYAVNTWDKADDSGAGLFTFKPMLVVKQWVRLTSGATDDRNGRCVELLRSGSPLLTTYKSNGAEVGRLWTSELAATEDAAYNYQFWSLEERASNKGKYALTCKAIPNGSVNAVPSGNGVTSRWTYDNTMKHYNFILGNEYYDKEKGIYRYSICSDNGSSLFMNASKSGQGFAVNVWGNPADQNAGLWNLTPDAVAEETVDLDALLDEAKLYLAKVKTYTTAEEKRVGHFSATATETLRNLVQKDLSVMTSAQLAEHYENIKSAYKKFWDSFGYLQQDKIYILENAVDEYGKVTLYDNNGALNNTADKWVDNAWEVTTSAINPDHSQRIRLQNTRTGRFFGNLPSTPVDRLGYHVGLAQEGSDITCTFNPEYQDFVVSINGRNIYPLLTGATAYPNSVFAGSTVKNGNAVRSQGAAWNLVAATVKTFDCVNDKGQSLGTYYRSYPLYDTEIKVVPPSIENYKFVSEKDGKYVYQRTAYVVRRENRDQYGALISKENVTVSVGQTYTVSLEVPACYTLVKSDYTEGQTVTVDRDLTISASYSHKGLNGVRKLGELVREVKGGHSYVIYDLSPVNTERKGYRMAQKDLSVNRSLNIEDAAPNHTWLLEGTGNTFKVKNGRYNLYVPTLGKSTEVTLNKSGDDFTFTRNPEGTSWKIKGTDGSCWDGLSNGSLVGWNDPGHPMAIYEYYVQPYFKVTVEYVDIQGNKVSEAAETLVKAGDCYTVDAKNISGYTLHEIKGAEATKAVNDHLNIQCIYGRSYQVTTHESSNIADRALATFSASYPTTPETPEVEAFWASCPNSENVVLKKIQAQGNQLVIPANVGVVLSTPSASTFKMKQVADAPTSGFDQNRMIAVGDKDKTVDPAVRAYVLTKKSDNNILFYLINSEQRTMKANRAYLVLPEIQNSLLNLSFDEVTGINTLYMEDGKTPVFDLNGRMVNRPLKRGIYIKNGNKFLVK